MTATSATLSTKWMFAQLLVKYGKVPLRAMLLVPSTGKMPQKVSAATDGKNLAVTVEEKGGSVNITFGPDIEIQAGQKLEVALSSGP
jgi:hypothetical protein